MLQVDQGVSAPRQRGHPRRIHAHGLAAHDVADIFASQEDLAGPEVDVQLVGTSARSPPRLRRIQREAGAGGGQRGDAVQGAGIQEVVTEARASSAASVPLPDAVGPSTQITGIRSTGVCTTENSASK
jgi:hypothetical protein